MTSGRPSSHDLIRVIDESPLPDTCVRVTIVGTLVDSEDGSRLDTLECGRRGRFSTCPIVECCGCGEQFSGSAIEESPRPAIGCILATMEFNGTRFGVDTPR